MQSKTIIDVLGNESIRNFIREHLKDNVQTLALAAKKYPEYNLQVLSSLILLFQKAEIKLPEHYKKLAAFNQKCYEQSTSEAVALYKASIMNIANKSIINITGGIGIDDWAMAKYASNIDSCEIDHDIHSMAEYNLSQFKITNVHRHLGDGIAFFETIDKIDIVYADPDRRANSGRVFKIEDSQPDVYQHMPLFLKKAKFVWLKLSPMADISYVLNLFPSATQLYIIAWLGEVKEILLCCSAQGCTDIKRVAINIGPTALWRYEAQKNQTPASYGNEGHFLYEPNKAIIKAELSADYASYCKLNRLATNSHFYISNHLIPDFYGRTFKIIERLCYKPKSIKAFLVANKITKANITARNFRETPEVLKVRYGLKDGGESYLCFTSDQQGLYWMYYCKKQ